jgi:DNA-binding transcriptional LysR family regulator
MKNLTDIAVFVRVVKAGSFTAAAEELGLSRSVISKYITRLEQRFAVRLLNRTTRRLSLTEAGNRFFEQSQAALTQLEDAEGEILAMQGEPSGLLRISAPSSFGVLHLASLLPQFQQDNPGLKIDLSIEDKQIDLVDAGIDLAIRIADLPDSSLVARRIAICNYVVCASPNYLAKNGTPGTPEDLAQHNCLSFQFWDTPNHWHFLGEDDRFRSVKIHGEVVSNNSLALRQILLSGGGITMTPTFLVGDDIANGRLIPVLGKYQCKSISIYAVYPHRKYLTAKVRAFINFLSDHIQPDTPYWDKAIPERY